MGNCCIEYYIASIILRRKGQVYHAFVEEPFCTIQQNSDLEPFRACQVA